MMTLGFVILLVPLVLGAAAFRHMAPGPIPGVSHNG